MRACSGGFSASSRSSIVVAPPAAAGAGGTAPARVRGGQAGRAQQRPRWDVRAVRGSCGTWFAPCTPEGAARRWTRRLLAPAAGDVLRRGVGKTPGNVRQFRADLALRQFERGRSSRPRASRENAAEKDATPNASRLFPSSSGVGPSPGNGPFGPRGPFSAGIGGVLGAVSSRPPFSATR